MSKKFKPPQTEKEAMDDLNKVINFIDHLENITNKEIQLLAKSNTIATLLPGCSFFLNINYANAKKMIQQNPCQARIHLLILIVVI